MGSRVTIGGQRLGSGKKMTADLHNYGRSTHDMSYTWRSTMAAGTLVPFMKELALPGDTWDINLSADCLTHPTIGPLFGSEKIQLDVFIAPIRLYQGKLHMNMLDIGLDMASVKLPQISMWGPPVDITQPIDNQQINPSCIFSYLDIRGIGQSPDTPEAEVNRYFNAVPYLAYWEIYKNYYSNKMEEIGVVIHREPLANEITITSANITGGYPDPITIPVVTGIPPYTYTNQGQIMSGGQVNIYATGLNANTEPSSILLAVKIIATGYEGIMRATDLMVNWKIYPEVGYMVGTQPKGTPHTVLGFGGIWQDGAYLNQTDTEPQLKTFPLKNIDTMRMNILAAVADTNPIVITKEALEPYGLALAQNEVGTPRYSQLYNQEGLGIKTYNSDLFNNWINTEWIDGADGINTITSVDSSDGKFTINELLIARKVYDMLNRIAVSGGTYDDWLQSVYTTTRHASSENPMYMGGLIKNLIFQEVISNSAAGDQPLGTLAGRGKMGGTNKGGKIKIKVDEPSYIIGIVSITPYMDYSQGNKWDTNLRTMDDLHKPAMDEIGFQDDITDQRAWFDTKVSSGIPIFKSAGKLPAWMNYMTNVDVVRGNFADVNQQMFMVLNRRYQANIDEDDQLSIRDLTTYIDPVKCNYIFADTRRDAQNYWMQIGVEAHARRVMSAKIMPNL